MRSIKAQTSLRTSSKFRRRIGAAVRVNFLLELQLLSLFNFFLQRLHLSCLLAASFCALVHACFLGLLAHNFAPLPLHEDLVVHLGLVKPRSTQPALAATNSYAEAKLARGIRRGSNVPCASSSKVARRDSCIQESFPSSEKVFATGMGSHPNASRTETSHRESLPLGRGRRGEARRRPPG